MVIFFPDNRIALVFEIVIFNGRNDCHLLKINLGFKERLPAIYCLLLLKFKGDGLFQNILITDLDTIIFSSVGHSVIFPCRGVTVFY